MRKRILGLDVGEVRIGVAVSDALGITAQAVSTIIRRELENDLAELQRLYSDLDADAVIVGFPLNMDGSVGPQAEKVQRFAEQLSQRLQVTPVLWDERLSSAEANKVLIEGGLRREKRKHVIDQAAAMLILQSYLDSPSSASPRPEDAA